MAASYTTRIRLTQQGDGDNPNSWGTVLNNGVISLVDDAIAGYTTVALGANATVTLSAVDGGSDEGNGWRALPKLTLARDKSPSTFFRAELFVDDIDMATDFSVSIVSDAPAHFTVFVCISVLMLF